MRPEKISAARAELFVNHVEAAIVAFCADTARPRWTFVKLATGGVFKTLGRAKPLKADRLLSRLTRDEINAAVDILQADTWAVDVNEHGGDLYLTVRHEKAPAWSLGAADAVDTVDDDEEPEAP